MENLLGENLITDEGVKAINLQGLKFVIDTWFIVSLNICWKTNNLFMNSNKKYKEKYHNLYDSVI